MMKPWYQQLMNETKEALGRFYVPVLWGPIDSCYGMKIDETVMQDLWEEWDGAQRFTDYATEEMYKFYKN